MEEARAVLARLERIEALDRSRAEPGLVLGELRELVREVEVWARRERDPRAEEACDLLNRKIRADRRTFPIGARVDPSPLKEGSAA